MEDYNNFNDMLVDYFGKLVGMNKEVIRAASASGVPGRDIANLAWNTAERWASEHWMADDASDDSAKWSDIFLRDLRVMEDECKLYYIQEA